MKKIYIILLILFLLGVVQAMESTSTSASTCLVSNSTDSKSFGSSLAISDRYLAVGDPEANRVVIYNYDDNGKWVRIREILPPKGSAADLAGSGFGYSLALKKEILVIGAYHEIPLSVTSSTQEKYRRKFVSGLFITDLGKQLIPKELLFKLLPNGAVYGFDVSTDSSLVAFGIRKEISQGIWRGSVGVFQRENSLQELRIIEPPEAKAYLNFGISTDIKNGLLLVAAPRSGVNGSAYLFNLKSKSSWQRLPNDNNIPSTGWFGGQVALSTSMAILGGNANSPVYTSSAVITTPQSQKNTISYLTPGGYVAVNEDFGVIASASPNPLTLSPIPNNTSDNTPVLIIINRSNIRKVILVEPLTKKKIDFIKSVAVSDNFVSIARQDNSKSCKVLIYPQEYLISISQPYP